MAASRVPRVGGGRWEERQPAASTASTAHKSRRAPRRSERHADEIELEVEADEERRDAERKMAMLAAAFGDNVTMTRTRRLRSYPLPADDPSDGSGSSSSEGCAPTTSSRASATITSAEAAPTKLVARDKAFRLVRRGSDPLVNDEFYATQVQVGNYVKMGWLTKQGHAWKTWKTRFFVLFSDGTFAYYKSKGRKKIQGCIQLNDGVVSVQHVDVRRAGKPYAFQIEKGFYRLLCYCCSQFEAELWVSSLRSVRRSASPCVEIDLTAYEVKAGSNAVARHLNKIFIADPDIADKVAEFKANEIDHSFASIQSFIVELDDRIIDQYHLEFYQDEAVEMLPGNELVRLIRRSVEDRIFIPLYASAYASLETYRLRMTRVRAKKNLKLFRTKPQSYFGIPDDLSRVCDWKDAIMTVNLLDCVSLPTHKLETILAAGRSIVDSIAQFNGKLFDVADETLTAIFRYVLSMSDVQDLPILRSLLKISYVYHPACQNKGNVVEAFLDAIKWIEGFETNDEASRLDPWTIAASRVTVSISTNDVGIQLTTDGNGRGAIVYSIRKLSQAALSASIVPGLALIGINDESVVAMPFQDVVRKLRTAPLPKRLTFLTEFYYYQLLSLDAEMFQYLMCLAASRGDMDSAGWLRGFQVDVNQICSWEKARGKQIFGFEPASGKSTPLHAAAHNGQSVMVKYLLGIGADPNVCNRKLKRPLHVVKQSLDMALIIELLVDAGADIDAAQRKGLTPLMSMCARGSLEGAATLLALGADIHRVAWSNGYSALEFCVAEGFADLVEVCLSKSANPNVPTLNGDTSLHLAASIGNAEILLKLLQHGANPNARNRFGQTPFAILLNASPALDRDAVGLCIDMLANAGCRPDTCDVFGRHVMHQAMILGDAMVHNKLVESNHCAEIDIFGCSADDYRQLGLQETAIHQFASANVANFWQITDVNGSVFGVASCSIEALIDSVLGAGTLNLADVLSFVLFLDTFASVNEVLDCIGNRIKTRQKGCGLIRLYIMIVLYKHNSTSAMVDVEDRFHALIARVLDVAEDDLSATMKGYQALYRRCMQLFGSESVLEPYDNVPTRMEQLYSFGDTWNFDPAFHFSSKFHHHVDAEEWAEHCTVVTHSLFCSIPIEDFIYTGSKHSHSPQFVSAKRWFQHLSAFVVNAVLSQESPQERADVIGFFLAAADHCQSLHNYDSLAAILYALQSTAVQRLRRTIDALSVEAKKSMNRMQVLSDKGCREMNRLMRNAPNPSMPYIGLYLQNFVGLNELPIFDKGGAINTSRLRKLGVMVVEILHRQTAPYALRFDQNIDALLHVTLPFECEDSRYQRSLELEPREVGAIPLCDRDTYVAVNDLDIESEVRESIGGEGTFGLRQWFRKQKLVHRNRSRSSVAQLYEWV